MIVVNLLPGRQKIIPLLKGDNYVLKLVTVIGHHVVMIKLKIYFVSLKLKRIRACIVQGAAANWRF